MTATILFVRMGQVERASFVGRGSRRRLRVQWIAAYSENGRTMPWLTRMEAQADVRQRGCKAIFVEPGGRA